MRQILLQCPAATLLQNATKVYYKMHQRFYYRIRQLYYKMRQVLKIATILLLNATVITKCVDTHMLGNSFRPNMSLLNGFII